jgi:hypothetical protein
VERGGNLLLLCGKMLLCRERLADTRLLTLIAVAKPRVAVPRLNREAAGDHAAGGLARQALSELALSELVLSELAEAWVAADLRADPLVSAVAGHHSGRPGDGGRQRVRKVLGIVSVRQQVLLHGLHGTFSE